MKTYIALLRGINVAGQKKIKMVDLKELFQKIGFTEVQTYIQSGNVVFNAKNDYNLADVIKAEISKVYGFEVPVLVVTALDLEHILKECPFREEKLEKSYFTLLSKTPDKQYIDSLNGKSFEGEEIQITDRCVYFYSANGYGKAKMNNNYIENKLKVAATTRNYKTIKKLLSLVAR